MSGAVPAGCLFPGRRPRSLTVGPSTPPMKAFLLAAGHGTRLRPLTDTIPKCLVPIRGISMLEIWLELCRRAGIRELFINLHAHADMVRTALASRDVGIN